MTMMMLATLMITLMNTLLIQSTNKNKTNKNMKTMFECGYNNMMNKKTEFSTNFIMLAMMFLVFDVEISLFMPIIMSNKMSITSTMMSNILMSMLMMITVKEWKQSSMEWSK